MGNGDLAAQYFGHLYAMTLGAQVTLLLGERGPPNES
jgi:hypothetical protein